MLKRKIPKLNFLPVNLTLTPKATQKLKRKGS